MMKVLFPKHEESAEYFHGYSSGIEKRLRTMLCLPACAHKNGPFLPLKHINNAEYNSIAHGFVQLFIFMQS